MKQVHSIDFSANACADLWNNRLDPDLVFINDAHPLSHEDRDMVGKSIAEAVSKGLQVAWTVIAGRLSESLPGSGRRSASELSRRFRCEVLRVRREASRVASRAALSVEENWMSLERSGDLATVRDNRAEAEKLWIRAAMQLGDTLDHVGLEVHVARITVDSGVPLGMNIEQCDSFVEIKAFTRGDDGQMSAAETCGHIHLSDCIIGVNGSAASVTTCSPVRSNWGTLNAVVDHISRNVKQAEHFLQKYGREQSGKLGDVLLILLRKKSVHGEGGGGGVGSSEVQRDSAAAEGAAREFEVDGAW